MKGMVSMGAHAWPLFAQKAAPPLSHSSPVARPPMEGAEDIAKEEAEAELVTTQNWLQIAEGQLVPQFTPGPGWKTAKRGSQLSSHGSIAWTQRAGPAQQYKLP